MVRNQVQCGICTKFLPLSKLLGLCESYSVRTSMTSRRHAADVFRQTRPRVPQGANVKEFPCLFSLWLMNHLVSLMR